MYAADSTVSFARLDPTAVPLPPALLLFSTALLPVAGTMRHRLRNT